MKRSFRKSICMLAVVLTTGLLLSGIATTHVFAYYNLGTVTLTLGDTNVSVERGKTVTISASADPNQKSETTGCGMAQCPQTCPPECNDANGQCVCAGPSYTTYHAGINATSNKTTIASVVQASNGVVVIKGISPGSTTVSVQAALRQYTSSPVQTIHVTVTSGKSTSPGAGVNSPGGSTGGTSTVGNSTGNGSTGGQTNNSKTGGGQAGGSATGGKSTGGSGSGNSNSASSTGNNAGDSAPSSVLSSASASSSSVSAESASSSGTSSTSMTGTLGVYDVIQLPENNISGKEELTKIQGKDMTATFQKKDSTDNVLYSWSFEGKDVKDPADFDMGLTFSGNDVSSVRKLVGDASFFYLNFAHHGLLPGKATVSIRVSDKFKDGQTLYFYYYDPDKKSVEQMAQGIKVVNGYADVTITHCSSYFLTARAIGTQGGFPTWGVAIIVLVVLIGLYFFGYRFYLVSIARGRTVPTILQKLYIFLPTPKAAAQPYSKEEDEHRATRTF